MGQRKPAVKDVAYPDDGVFEKGLSAVADQFGHTTRAEKVKTRPADLAMSTASNIVGAFARDP